MTSPAADAWIAGVRELGGDVALARGSAEELLRRYGEPHRRYHTLAHVEQVVRDAAWLGGELGLDAVEQAQLALAAAAHDVVYDAWPGADERASADWAADHLTTAGLAPESARRVADLVLTTITHLGPPDDRAAAALLDADLAVLGAPPDAYGGYAAAVRLEYAAVPDEHWRAGRAEVLRTLLAREPLFCCAPAARRWAEAAVRNLRAELSDLETQQRPSPSG